MTDTSRSGDLVKRLRVNDAEIYLPILGQAADRIEELASMEECLTAELGDANDRIEALEAENERLRLDVEAQEALQVSAYHAGLRAGWNFGVSDDNAGMQAAMANTHPSLALLAAILRGNGYE